ncbi:MAG: DUF1186 domain-containing protein [Proteobacteria bacterium]|nr:DUF1186 domain-containing protein [Pseudomonadota bacterium]
MYADDVMSTDEAIKAFAEAKKELPIGAMLWCRDNWAAAAPDLLGVLERFVAGADRSDAAANALFMIVHLAAERGETRAFAPLCRLARDAPALDHGLGDGVTETFNATLISTYDGNLNTLTTLIEAPEAEEFARVAALEALGYLTVSGRIDADATADYLQRLYDTLQPQAIMWYGWISMIALLRLESLDALAKAAFARELVPPEWGDEDDYAEMRRNALSDSNPLASFTRKGIGPLEDAIDELSQWVSFSGEQDGIEDNSYIENLDAEDLDVDAVVEDMAQRMLRNLDAKGQRNLGLAPAKIVTAVNPYKGVGRNDPCPCGSGKKFKNCCLK